MTTTRLPVLGSRASRDRQLVVTEKPQECSQGGEASSHPRCSLTALAGPCAEERGIMGAIGAYQTTRPILPQQRPVVVAG